MKRKKLLIGVGISLLPLLVLLGIYVALHQFLPFNPNHFSVRGYRFFDERSDFTHQMVVVRNNSIFFKRVSSDILFIKEGADYIRYPIAESPTFVPPLSDFNIVIAPYFGVGWESLTEYKPFPISSKDGFGEYKGSHSYYLTEFTEIPPYRRRQYDWLTNWLNTRPFS